MKQKNYSCNDGCWLSVVVIGRNVARTLPALLQSLPAGPGIEVLYVDSLSTDGSAGIAVAHGARVFTLEEHPSLSPATGRYVGTREAAGKWILFLDGDMVLKEEFARFLYKIKDEDAIPAKTVGFVGRTFNCYLNRDGEVESSRDNVCLPARAMGPPEQWGRVAGYHGGAVLYLREAVLRAGNWNPAVFQLEEIDLYSRVRGLGCHIRAVDLPMVDHYTSQLSLWEKLRLNFCRNWGDKKLYGAGQVLVSRWKQRSLLNFIRYYPYPFAVFFGLLIIPSFLIWLPLPFIVNALLLLWLSATKKWYSYLIYLGNVVQSLRGVFHYHPFEPGYRAINR